MPVDAEEFVDRFLQKADDHLAHARVYDPVKRKEYYERTKKNRGRNPGNQPTNIGEEVGSSNQPSKAGPSPAERAANRAAANAKKVKSIRTKIDKVTSHLDGLVKIRNSKRAEESSSNSETKDKSESSKDTKDSTESKEDKPAEKLSAAEKAKKNKEAREKYEEENPQTPEDMSVEELDEKIALGRRRVKELKSRLREAIETDRSKP